MTDINFYTTLQYHLVETTDGGITYGSGLYNSTEVLARLNFRLKEFYKRTNLVTARDITISTVANTRDQDYPATMIDVIRLGIECD